MLSSGFQRFLPRGFNAFTSEADFKSKVADTLFELADIFSLDYEKLGDSFIIDVQDDSLSLHTLKHDILCSRQTPNREIWVSTPISGSLKFDYDSDVDQWLDTKDSGVDLKKSLHDEIERTLQSEKQ